MDPFPTDNGQATDALNQDAKFVAEVSPTVVPAESPAALEEFRQAEPVPPQPPQPPQAPQPPQQQQEQQQQQQQQQPQAPQAEQPQESPVVVLGNSVAQAIAPIQAFQGGVPSPIASSGASNSLPPASNTADTNAAPISMLSLGAINFIAIFGCALIAVVGLAAYRQRVKRNKDRENEIINDIVYSDKAAVPALDALPSYHAPPRPSMAMNRSGASSAVSSRSRA
ncbi:hypothetical protein BDR26DRAFT_880466 [Obelidium mucronatum]|nr:hypothetical protein BDR26DRAFT_880466 [Obelidium mucronatum]